MCKKRLAHNCTMCILEIVNTVLLSTPTTGNGHKLIAKRKVSAKEGASLNIPAKFLGQIEGYYWKAAIRTWRKESVKPAWIDYEFVGRRYRVTFA